VGNDTTIFTDEELEDLDKALATAAAVCAGLGGGPTCAMVAGVFSSAAHWIDWVWDDVIPDGWKAEGVYDWQTPYDPIFKELCSIHERAVLVVDETWRRVRTEKGLPPQPSLAGAFLNDWVYRNGWQDGGKKTFEAESKERWIALDPASGPWAFKRGPMPKRGREPTIKAFVAAILDLMHAKRLSVLNAAIRATMEFIALDVCGSRWKTNAGKIREASWVHGTAFDCERRSDVHAVERLGWGTRYSADLGRSLWFHIQIPTPVLIDEIRPVCSKVFLLYETAGCRLRALHVYDGANKILEISNLSGSGNQKESLNSSNSWLLFPCPTVQSGLGLSALIGFQEAPAGGPSTARPWVTFSTAGADFNRSR